MNLTFHEFCELLPRDLLDPLGEMSLDQMRIQLAYSKAAARRLPILTEAALARYGALFAAIQTHPSHQAKVAEGESYRRQVMSGGARLGRWWE